jgi:cobyrinic acid a,c-diamide synthase
VSSPFLGPRLVVAGTHSGVGKTTVATGIMAALRRAGQHPAAAKVGPDFIDPGYHALATGRPPRNLDAWLCGAGAMAGLAGRAAAGADVLIIEGVMGLFDGASDGTASSTADVARLLDAPVLLVVDASAMSDSVAAVVQGFATYRADVRVGGVILNQVGSAGHETLLREALAGSGIPVLGALPRDDAFRWRDRHLGLVPVAEQPAQVGAAVDRLAHSVAAHVDLGALMRVAAAASHRHTEPVALPGRGPDIRVGLAGGFPEVHAVALAANTSLLTDLRQQASAGLPTWAECGGLLLLARRLDGHQLAGVIPAHGAMTDRLTLGYREAVITSPTPLGPAGTATRGHEFHYSNLDPPGDALQLRSRWGTRTDGWASPTLLATYLHHHPGGDPGLVAAFARTCALRRTLRSA